MRQRQKTRSRARTPARLVGLAVLAGLVLSATAWAQQQQPTLRDPFRSLFARKGDTEGGPEALPPGKRGLVIPQLALEGIVITPMEKIAVVTMRGRNRAYFLREGDEVYQGRVLRISADTVVFRESGKDAFGAPVHREVTKQLSGSGANP